MRRIGRTLILATLAGVQVSAATTAFGESSGAAAPWAPPPCDSSWNVVANAASAAGYLSSNGLTALSSSDIWGVGADQTYSGVTMAEHWDGSTWTVKTTPDAGSGPNSLRGVSAVPGKPNDVYAVGSYLESSYPPQRTLIEHWDGTIWSVVSSPNASSAANELDAVVALAANDVWAVGSWDNVAGPQTLTEHFDGLSWTVVPSPNVASAENHLVAVSATSATDVWAAGYYRSSLGGGGQGLFEHWDGTAWTIKTNPTAGQAFISGVLALSPTSVWAAGDVYDPASNLARTFIEHWDGTSWGIVASPNGDLMKNNSLFSISGVFDSNIWAVGQVQSPGAITALTEHWNGSTWSIVPSPSSASFTRLTSVIATSPTNVWATGDGTEGVVTQNLCISLPAVSGLEPVSGNTSGGTQVIINGSGFTFATDVKFGSTSATGFTVNSDSQITAVSPAGSVGSVDVIVTNYAGSSATTPPDIFLYVPAAVSWKQYTLVSSDGASWKEIDATNLKLTLTPSVNSNAIISGNADLWTATAGVNQDLGIFISGGDYDGGQLYAWKESGGFAGTFSPNAAFVQTVIPLTGGITYTVTLQWKANHATAGTIFAGAGLGPAYSPTRLTAELLPATDALESAVSPKQYTLTGSDGSTWQDLDSGGTLTLNFRPATNGSVLLSGNADLWTQTAGVNQDLGIFVSGGTFGNGQVVGWKESGGLAGTFSPNAAYVQTVASLNASTTYTITLQWKANDATSGTIWAGAGIGPQYSPTRLTVRFFPAGTGLIDAKTNLQYSRFAGLNWISMDWQGLTLRITPTTDSNWILGANADLWTAVVDVNQDIGILISGGEFGVGRLVAWKESGGFAGTFSPNAAFLQTLIRLKGGTTYTVILAWKANHAASGLIYTAAGLGPQYSPTRLTAHLMTG